MAKKYAGARVILISS